MIELYIASVTPLEDAERYERLLASVHPARRTRIEHLRLAQDRRRALAAQLLLEHALHRRGIEAPSCSYGEHGKPTLDGNVGVHFNLSHAGDYAVCAISDAELGVDIERIDPSIHCLAIADRFFLPEEASWIRAGESAEASVERFFRLWTLKESYLKATGKGFSLPACTFSFSMDGESTTLKTKPAELSADYFFKELSCIDGYRLSLCAPNEVHCDIISIDFQTLC